LENELTRRLNSLPKVLFEDDQIKIAHISFAFDNKKLIAALMKRGSLITSGKFDKLDSVNEKIDQMAVEDADKISRPVAAYITFET
jgi:hypothetical protein